MTLLQSEILELFEKAKSREEKVAILKKYQTPVLQALMRLNFDKTVKMDLPEGDPPFKKENNRPIGYQESNLVTEYRRFYIWLDPKQNISKMRKEQLFIELLESLHVSEAEILLMAKDRKLTKKFKTLKLDIVKEAYPYTIPPQPEEPKKLPLE